MKMELGEIMDATEQQIRWVGDISYLKAGCIEARKLGSERFLKDLKNFLWYLNSSGLSRPGEAREMDFQAYRPLAERMVVAGLWQPDALSLFPKSTPSLTSKRSI